MEEKVNEIENLNKLIVLLGDIETLANDPDDEDLENVDINDLIFDCYKLIRDIRDIKKPGIKVLPAFGELIGGPFNGWDISAFELTRPTYIRCENTNYKRQTLAIRTSNTEIINIDVFCYESDNKKMENI